MSLASRTKCNATTTTPGNQSNAHAEANQTKCLHHGSEEFWSCSQFLSFLFLFIFASFFFLSFFLFIYLFCYVCGAVVLCTATWSTRPSLRTWGPARRRAGLTAPSACGAATHGRPRPSATCRTPLAIASPGPSSCALQAHNYFAMKKKKRGGGG